MLKKKSDKKVSLGMQCGDCIHFEKVAKYEQPCAMLGVHRKSKAPDCFSPDVFKLRDVENPDLLGDIGKLFRKLTPKQSRILSFVLSKQGGALNRKKVKFGQPVYFCLGSDYVSHYFKGYVVSADDESVYVVSKLKPKAENNISASFPRDSIFTHREYKEIEKKLLAEGRVCMTDEDKKRMKKLPTAELLDKKGRVPHVEQFIDNYEPPTLDTAPAEWHDIYAAAHQSREKDKKKKLKSKNVFYKTDGSITIQLNGGTKHKEEKRKKEKDLEKAATKLLKKADKKDKKKSKSKGEEVW